MGILACVIFLAALGVVLNFAQCESNEDDSDDEESLREALLLIKLIRKAADPDTSLQHELSKHAPAPVSAPLSPDAPQELHNASFYNNTSTFQQGQSIYRRSMPEEKNYRRSMDVGGESATTDGDTIALSTESAITRTATPKNFSEASSPVATSEVNPSTSAAIKATPTTVKASVLPAKVAVARSGNKTQFKNKKLLKKANTRQIKKLMPKNIQQPRRDNFIKKKDNLQPSEHPPIGNVQVPNDPIINQVTSELETEMKTIVIIKENAAKAWRKILNSKTFNSSPTKLPTTLRIHLQGSSENATKAWRKFLNSKNFNSSLTKPPTTLRIHLQGSSRYPIPFPENHALCYTDPKNGLCGVLI